MSSKQLWTSYASTVNKAHIKIFVRCANDARSIGLARFCMNDVITHRDILAVCCANLSRPCADVLPEENKNKNVKGEHLQTETTFLI